MYVKKGHDDVPIRSHIDMVLSCHKRDLIRIQSSEGKHTYLLYYVTPVAWCSCHLTLKVEPKFYSLNICFYPYKLKG